MSGWANHIEPTRGTRHVQYVRSTRNSQWYWHSEGHPPLRSDQPIPEARVRIRPLSTPQHRAQRHYADCCGRQT